MTRLYDWTGTALSRILRRAVGGGETGGSDPLLERDYMDYIERPMTEEQRARATLRLRPQREKP